MHCKDYDYEDEESVAEKVLIPGAASSAAENPEIAPVVHLDKYTSSLLWTHWDHKKSQIERFPCIRNYSYNGILNTEVSLVWSPHKEIPLDPAAY